MSEKKEKNNNIEWIAYLLPIVILCVFAFAYVILFARGVDEKANLWTWLIGNTEDIFVWIFRIAFVASLFNVGRILQKKRPAYHKKAVVRDREAYRRALELYENMQNSKVAGAADAKIAMRNVMERLRNESAFGTGSDKVIQCENEIMDCLQKIDECAASLFDEKTVQAAVDNILTYCKTIQAKLRLRMELKRK